MKNKKTTKKNNVTKSYRQLKSDDGLVLHSRQGTEEGFLLEGNDGSVTAWFFEDSNNLVSAETLMRWAKQAETYEKALKVLKKKSSQKQSKLSKCEVFVSSTKKKTKKV